MGTLAVLADAIRYPEPDRLGGLQKGAAELAERTPPGRSPLFWTRSQR